MVGVQRVRLRPEHGRERPPGRVAHLPERRPLIGRGPPPGTATVLPSTSRKDPTLSARPRASSGSAEGCGCGTNGRRPPSAPRPSPRRLAKAGATPSASHSASARAAEKSKAVEDRGGTSADPPAFPSNPARRPGFHRPPQVASENDHFRFTTTFCFFSSLAPYMIRNETSAASRPTPIRTIVSGSAIPVASISRHSPPTKTSATA